MKVKVKDAEDLFIESLHKYLAEAWPQVADNVSLETLSPYDKKSIHSIRYQGISLNESRLDLEISLKVSNTN